jgi:hypothetical protein
MNMAKLGTVSTGGKHFHSSLKSNKFNVLGVTPYTLCEVYYVIQNPTCSVNQALKVRILLVLLKK